MSTLPAYFKAQICSYRAFQKKDNPIFQLIHKTFHCVENCVENVYNFW